MDADITVAVQPVLATEAGRFGILKRDEAFRITNFAEKPKDPALLKDLVSRNDPERPYLGSMGIYLFKTQVLIDLLETTVYDDFGGHVIPHAIYSHSVFGYDFDDYWEDIGTIRSFYETNLALTVENPRFNFYDMERPIYSSNRFLPGSIVTNSSLKNVLMAEGCCIRDAEISHSIVGLRTQIRKGVRIADTILMGSDYYDRPGCDDETCNHNSHDIPLGIGSGCQIEGAIIDKNARLGKGVIIKPFPRGTDIDGDNWVVRDGIVVIPKDSVIPAGTVITPESESVFS
jgi:glucose-1-phosphate adenylyltransferase